MVFYVVVSFIYPTPASLVPTHFCQSAYGDTWVCVQENHLTCLHCAPPPTHTPLHLQRFASEKEGDREVQRTMLELLNQLDGFSSNNDIKVCATARVYTPTHSHMYAHRPRSADDTPCV